MITAKDIFVLEQEMIAETQKLLYGTGLSSEEQEEILYHLNGLTEAEYCELNKRLSDNQLNSLDRLKNGEFLGASQTNEAVLRAIKRDE